MQTVIRTYSGNGARELIDLLEENSVEVDAIIRAVTGLVSYTLARTESGGFSVTVCQDQAGIDESVEVARDWIGQNASHINAAAPQVTDGVVIVQV